MTISLADWLLILAAVMAGHILRPILITLIVIPIKRLRYGKTHEDISLAKDLWRAFMGVM